MNKKDNFAQLLELIPEDLFPKGKEKTRDLRLEEDLYIYGDDADEFILDFSEKFNVDISEFDCGKYFTPEFSFHVCNFYFLNKFFFSKNKKELTLGDLEKAIEIGKLE